MKKSLMIGLTLVMLLQICITVLPERDVQAAGGTTYYVSSSEGNDANPGTSQAKPWKTLAKVSSTVFQKGDKILLKMDDIWRESVDLKAVNGKGTQTLGAYGVGEERPYIAPQNSNGLGGYAVGIFSSGESKNDGWQIVGLEIGETGHGILMRDSRVVHKNDGDTLSNGLTVKDCYIHDCSRNLPEGPMGGFVAGVSTKSDKSYIDNVRIENVLFERCELAIQGGEIRYFEVLKSDAMYCEYYGFEFDDAKYGLIKGCTILHTGTKKRESGTTGMEFDMYSQHIVVDDCEIGYTVSKDGSADGCGIDFEGWTYDMTVANCYFHDNAGRPFLMMGYPSSETKIYNNYCVNNGTDHDSIQEPAFFLWGNETIPNGGEIAGNVIIKAEPGQATNWINWESVDRFPRSVNAHDNIVIPYGETHPAPPRREIENVTVTGDRMVWDFSSGANGWWPGDGVDCFKVENGVLSGAATKHTPEINSSGNMNLKITKYPYIKMVMKNESSATAASLTFRTDTNMTVREEAFCQVEIVPFDTEYREYIFDMTLAKGYSGILADLCIQPVNGAEAGGFKIKSITLSANKETTYKDNVKVSTGSLKSTVASFDFSSGVPAGWTASGMKTNGNTLTMQKGQEGYILSPEHLNIDLHEANAISIKMKNATLSDSASISFVTEQDGYYDLVKTEHFKINKSGSGVTEYIIDLSDNDRFTGTLKEFRINPGRAESGTVQIQSISIGSK